MLQICRHKRYKVPLSKGQPGRVPSVLQGLNFGKKVPRLRKIDMCPRHYGVVFPPFFPVLHEHVGLT